MLFTCPQTGHRSTSPQRIQNPSLLTANTCSQLYHTMISFDTLPMEIREQVWHSIYDDQTIVLPLNQNQSEVLAPLFVSHGMRQDATPYIFSSGRVEIDWGRHGQSPSSWHVIPARFSRR